MHPRELDHRHQLDVRDAKVHQVVEPCDGRLESAGRGERADVQLVRHGGVLRWRLPARVGPCEGRVVHAARGAVNARRLPGGSRVGKRLTAVEAQCVGGVRAHAGQVDGPPATRTQLHLDPPAFHDQLHSVGIWRPYTECGHRSSRALPSTTHDEQGPQEQGRGQRLGRDAVAHSGPVLRHPVLRTPFCHQQAGPVTVPLVHCRLPKRCAAGGTAVAFSLAP